MACVVVRRRALAGGGACALARRLAPSPALNVEQVAGRGCEGVRGLGGGLAWRGWRQSTSGHQGVSAAHSPAALGSQNAKTAEGLPSHLLAPQRREPRLPPAPARQPLVTSPSLAAHTSSRRFLSAVRPPKTTSWWCSGSYTATWPCLLGGGRAAGGRAAPQPGACVADHCRSPSVAGKGPLQRPLTDRERPTGLDWRAACVPRLHTWGRACPPASAAGATPSARSSSRPGRCCSCRPSPEPRQK
jgi:hypothetical protein